MEPPAINLIATYNLTKEGLGNISINLENSGGIRFSNITLNLDLPEDFILYKDNENKYQTSFDSVNPESSDYILTSILENVSVGSKESKWVKVEGPVLPQEIEIPIHINAQGYDLDNALLNVSRDMNLTIEPSIIMRKATLNRSLDTAEDYFNINDRFYVMITISNLAITEADNIKLNESLLNSNFVLDPDSPLVWTFNLPGRHSRYFVYYLKPVSPGEVKVSTTKISREYKGLLYENSIDPTTVMIYGPYFKISKTLDKYSISPGETVTVTVAAENQGNHAAFLTLSDEIPSFSQFVDGSLNDSGMVLKPGKTLAINYQLTIEELGDFRFPSATGQYAAMHDNGIVYSTRPMIHVSKPTPTPTMTQAIDTTQDHNESNNTGQSGSSTIPGFSVVTSLVILILFYFNSKMKKFEN
ncbi:MAG: DUF11 domain-containing protein [ANME-2 cluster archaeon]|nr:DUF11 domain-containing protein [ANME-2 cluster archaeon]